MYVFSWPPTYFPFILFPFFVAMNDDVMNALVADFSHAHENFLSIFLESWNYWVKGI